MGFPRFSEGNTAVHEVGHFLGLEHTFKPDSLCGVDNDEVDDTNNERFASKGSLSNLRGKRSCNSPDPIFNYMTYSDDPVLRKFTNGQAGRIVRRLEVAKPYLGRWLIQDPGGEDPYRVGNGDSLPNPITQDLHIEGTWRVPGKKLESNDSVKYFEVKDGVRLTVLDGTTLGVEDSVQVKVDGGSKIIADGTPYSWVRFESSAEGSYWNGINLKSGGNRFDHAIIDGGGSNTPLTIHSKDNKIRRSIIRGGYTNGIFAGVNFDGEGGRSGFLLENSLVEDNGGNSSGIMLQSSNAVIRRSTIRNNARRGIHMHNADIKGFQENVVSGNGLNGLRVTDGGLIDFDEEAHTRVSGNAFHEIFVRGDGHAILGTIDDDGHNDIFDGSDNSSDEKFVYNRSDNVVYARDNYWGGELASDDLYGDVRHGQAEPSGYTEDSGAPQYVLQRSAGGPQQQGASTQQSTSQTSVSGSKAGADVDSGADVSASSESSRSELRQRMAELRRQLRGDPASPRSGHRMRELYGLQIRDRENQLGEKQANMAAIARFRGKSQSTSFPKAVARTAGEEAVLIALHDAMREERYEDATTLIEDYGPRIEMKSNRRTLLHKQLSLFKIKGELKKALSTLGQLREITPTQTGEEAEASPSRLLDQIERRLRERLGDTGAAEAALAEGAKQAQSSEAARSKQASEPLPDAFELGGAYPNPTSGRVSLPLELPEEAQVHAVVYDALGRQVRRLADGRTFTAGRPTLRFTTGALSSGLYLIRVKIEAAASGQTHTFTKKITVVR